MDKLVKIRTSSFEVNSNNMIQRDNCIQYEFINLGNVPVVINGVFLDRYYSGTPTAPTVISGSFNKWAPMMKKDEVDLTQYNYTFQPKYYPGVTAYPRLIVIVKQRG